jgi:hypothetical protein
MSSFSGRAIRALSVHDDAVVWNEQTLHLWPFGDGFFRVGCGRHKDGYGDC